MPPTVVIVGASLAGASAAATLRQEGFDGDVMLIGAEPQLPYERPPLSKQYLRGELPFERMLVRPAAFYEENRIETLLGVPAAHVDPDSRTPERPTHSLRQASPRDRGSQPSAGDPRVESSRRVRTPLGH